MQVRPSGHAVDHSDYLMMLQQKNRLLKKMRVKDPQQVKMERKEQGFTLYLNREVQYNKEPSIPAMADRRL